MTVPFGKFEDVGWLINYDMDHLTELVKSSQLDIVEQLYFGWMPGGGARSSPDYSRIAGTRQWAPETPLGLP